MTTRTLYEAAIDRCTTALLDQGYCIVPNAVPPATIKAIANDLDHDFASTPFGQGGFYGERTKRFGRLLARSPGVAALVGHAVIQGTAERVLSPWCDCLQLNVAQAIAVHPGAPAQMPHRDQDMWRIEPGRAEYLLNVIWPLGRFDADNGATLVWPRSHGASATGEPVMDAIVAEMDPGSALLFLGSTLHGAGTNESADERRAIVVGYALGWLKPYENQWLAYRPGDRLDPALLAADLASSVTPVRDALYLLVGEGLVTTRTGDGFHLPQLTEPELRDRYAWHADVVLLALRDRAPAQKVSARPASDPDDLFAGIATIFAGIGAASRNGEHRLAIAALGDQLSPIRRVEPVVLDGLAEEWRALEGAWRDDDPAALRRLILGYHRRRVRAAAEIVRALYRADLA